MDIPIGIVADKYQKGLEKANYAFVKLTDNNAVSYELISFIDHHNGSLQKRIETLKQEHQTSSLDILRMYATVDQVGATILYGALADLCKGKLVDLEHVLE